MSQENTETVEAVESAEPVKTTKTAKARRESEAGRVRRDADSAIRAAAEMVATAQRAAKAVEAYHAAADSLEEAARIAAEATGKRLEALREMRAAGLSINEISGLTGLSPSRLQSLTRQD